MFKVGFKWGEDAMYGIDGWIPELQPDFNMTEGFGLAHDVLEHGPNDTGSIEDEMKAIGAMIYVRVLGGWFYRRPVAYSQEQILANDLSTFISQMNMNHGKYVLDKPPSTYRVRDEEVEDIIDAVIAKTGKGIREELRYNTYDAVHIRAALQTNMQRLRGWLRIGFRQAKKRYHNANPCNVEHLFWRMTKALESPYYKSAEHGDRLEVRVCPKKLDFELKVIVPDYDDYY